MCSGIGLCDTMSQNSAQLENSWPYWGEALVRAQDRAEHVSAFPGAAWLPRRPAAYVQFLSRLTKVAAGICEETRRTLMRVHPQGRKH